MSEHAASNASRDPEFTLPSGMLSRLDPQLIGQLQQFMRTEWAQHLEAERLRLESQIAARLEAQITARLEAQFDSRVAHEVAQKVQQIIEQNRLARHRQFGPSSESGQGLLFNEAELLAGQPDPTDDPIQPEPAGATPSRRQAPAGARGHRRAQIGRAHV